MLSGRSIFTRYVTRSRQCQPALVATALERLCIGKVNGSKSGNVFSSTSTIAVLQTRNFSAKVSLQDLKDLRLRSGAPMVECQKALKESNGEIDAALDWLRRHGAQKASAKLSGRLTTEGMVGMTIRDGKKAALVRVAAETDFASRSDSFVQLVQSCADSIVDKESTSSLTDVDEALSVPASDGQSTTVKDLLDEAIIAIRENIRLDSVYYSDSSSVSKDALWIGYVHNKRGDTSVGTAASMVLVSGGSDAEKLQDIGKKLAMHIVAAKPDYLRRDDIPQDLLDKEKDIIQETIPGAGDKKPEVLERIINGKMQKFYEGVCLLDQAHMIEADNPRVSKFLEGQVITLHEYKYVSI